MTAVAYEPEPVPLVKDAAGRLVVAGTRVPLETLIARFKSGDSAEETREQFPTVALADIYAVFAYYLRHTAEVEAYLAEREQLAEDMRARVEADFPPDGLRARLLARLGQ